MKKIFILSTLTLLVSCVSISVLADAKDWSKYRTVERKKHNYPTTTYQYTDPYGRHMTQEIPVRPIQQHNHYSNRPYPYYPQQNGVTIIYNQSIPIQTEYHTETRGFVNGDSNSSIESSSYTLISDWRRYGLPDPQVGMHWIYENRRYVQIPNTR